jgi:Glu-tRNA(Gln) amidotransferase subunit E-like FAD-binding protein
MKLNREEIDNIIDNISDDIADDLWNEVNEDWVSNVLKDYTKCEYDNEDLNEIIEELQTAQKEMQDEVIFEEKETLYQEIDNFIEGRDIHLNSTDIGAILVKLANDYLNLYV